ncbi:Alpha/Beta hydrolase protein [Xylariales sp. PMI_506]|nr:Alpha/Beta hydrolase protein [Xylariales sp. PMI_506]
MIGVSRPGYSRSTYQQNRQLLDWPKDLLALADHLQIERFAVVGISGGGPYVLSCIHSLPKSRCVGAAIVAGMYPSSLGMDGMDLLGRLLFTVAPWLPSWLLTKIVDQIMGDAARDIDHPERLLQVMNRRLSSRPKADQETWLNDEGGIKEILIDSLREGLHEGSQGAAWDLRLLGRPWEFKLDDILVKPGTMIIWHGGDDINVPAAMARKAYALLGQNAELRIADSEGHISLPVRKKDEIMDVLRRMLRDD